MQMVLEIMAVRSKDARIFSKNTASSPGAFKRVYLLM
jgi:hypothetical protein